MPKPSHTPLFRETVDNPQETELLGEEKGEQVGLKRKGGLYTCRTSQGRGSVLGHYGIIPLYMLHEAEDLGTIT